MVKSKGKMLFNPNSTPVVCDKDGRIVDGAGRREVDELDDVGQEAVDNGLLVLEDGDQDENESADKPASKEADKASSKPKGSGTSGASAPKEAV